MAMKVSISLPDAFVTYLDQRVDNRSQLIESLLQQWRKNQEDQAMAEACVILDQMKLGWDEECEHAAITDWEAFGL
jgi:antitoxin ParD1/3/4